MIKLHSGHKIAALFVCILLFIPGCLQIGRQATPTGQGGLSGKTSSFSMGGVDLKISQPQGYVDAPSAIRQAVTQSFIPPENIFAVYVAASDTASGRDSGQKLLRNRKIVVVSARPEFNREIVDQPFYLAMQRDISRVEGQFSAERIAQFKVLTESYYARDDAFSHNLGVYDSSRTSTSVVRLMRQADSRGAGASSAYIAAAQAEEGGPKMVLGDWAKTYFARAYHQVAIQNVLFLNGRCFNIHFFAPLAGENDIYSAMQENKNYIDALVGNIAELNRAPGGFATGGQNAADATAPARVRRNN